MTKYADLLILQVLNMFHTKYNNITIQPAAQTAVRYGAAFRSALSPADTGEPDISGPPSEAVPDTVWKGDAAEAGEWENRNPSSTIHKRIERLTLHNKKWIKNGK